MFLTQEHLNDFGRAELGGQGMEKQQFLNSSVPGVRLFWYTVAQDPQESYPWGCMTISLMSFKSN